MYTEEIDIKIKKNLANLKNKLLDMNYIKGCFLDKNGDGAEKILMSLPSINIFLGEYLSYTNYNDSEYIIKSSIRNFEVMKSNLNKFDILSNFYGIPAVIISSQYLGNFNKTINYDIEIIIKKMLKYYEKIILSIEYDINLKKMKSFECMRGITGIISFLLRYKNINEVNNIIKRLLKLIVSFSNETIVNNNLETPSWFITYNESSNFNKLKFKSGYLDFSVSHGISGILSILSIAIKNGYEVEGQKDTIAYILNEIYKYRDNNSLEWPSKICIEKYDENMLDSKSNIKNLSWCYGGGGTSRAVYLAGQAISDNYYVNDSIDYMKKLCLLDIDDLNFNNPMFCHGYSGLLYLENTLSKEINSKELKIGLNNLINEIFNFYDNDAKFNFKYNTGNDSNIVLKDLESLNYLEGVVSIALSLMSIESEPIMDWDKALLIN